MTDTANSKDLTVPQAANRISELGSTEEILAFIGSDDRKGVTEAADARLAELAAVPADSGIVRLGAGSDPRAQAGKPLESGGSGKKLVRTRFPLDKFEHGLEGVPVITGAGVEVDASKIEKLLEIAAAHNTRLEEVEAR